jgi:hypothetical protein
VIFSSTVISDSIFCGNGAGISGNNSSIVITGSLISGNTTGIGGDLCSVNLTSCTVTGNGTGASGFRMMFGFQYSILWGNCTEAVVEGMSGRIGFGCSAVNSAGVSCATCANPPSYDAHTIFVDPVFCDPEACNNAPTCVGDYGLSANSPCLASASPCGVLMGARGEACNVVAVEPRTWGAVKSLYR